MIPGLPKGLIVDNFAGGGGASLGIALALGRGPDIAINHDAEAIALHRANHPGTEHFCQSVWKVDPAEIAERGPIALAWFSPDCKHFSKAKGGKPVEKHIRDLAWVVVHWARRAKPAVIALENVEEFKDWGPLVTVEDGTQRPCPLRKGLTFRRWVRELQRAGYVVEYRELRACDYGAPTIRRRLFLVARRDGLPIVWPKPTHCDPRAASRHTNPGGTGPLLPWRTAADCIDWSIPCPSIFDRKRPLAEATLRRIARGVMKYVVNAARPFIVPITHTGDLRSHGIDEPLRTVTTAQRGEQAVVVPSIVGLAHGDSGGRREYPIDDPIGTVQAGGNNHALLSATMIGVGGRAGQSRPRGADEPLATLTAKADGAVVAAFLAQHNTEKSGAANPGRAADAPVSTITGRGTQQQVAAVHLTAFTGTGVGSAVDEPTRTVRTGGERGGGHQGLVAATLSHQYTSNTAGGQGDPGRPLKTVTTGGNAALILAFLTKYYTAAKGGQDVTDPLHAVTAKARHGLVTVTVDGVDYAIVDIGMRMLTPRELYRAQGFPDSYAIDVAAPDGKKLTKTAQIRMCGNSVCPPVAEALIRANFADQIAHPEERIVA